MFEICASMKFFFSSISVMCHTSVQFLTHCSSNWITIRQSERAIYRNRFVNSIPTIDVCDAIVPDLKLFEYLSSNKIIDATSIPSHPPLQLSFQYSNIHFFYLIFPALSFARYFLLYYSFTFIQVSPHYSPRHHLSQSQTFTLRGEIIQFSFWCWYRWNLSRHTWSSSCHIPDSDSPSTSLFFPTVDFFFFLIFSSLSTFAQAARRRR